MASLREEAAGMISEAEASSARTALLSLQLGERAAELEAAAWRVDDLNSRVCTGCVLQPLLRQIIQ